MLPIKRIVMFKHGVALFQRTGTVEGDQLIELSFKSDQMNDVLKSLTALDFDGGRFTSLSYDSEEPLQRRLSAINIAIPENSAYAAFLGGLKGAVIRIARGGEQVEGAIVGLEEVRRATDNGVLVEPHLSLLTATGRLLRLPLLEVGELEFLDEDLNRDMKALLDTLYSSLQEDRKHMSIKAVGEGSRHVSLSYVIESPLWKTSYRLVLPDGQDDKPLLQGWALVDNTTDEDWSDVHLSLVAGLPISFVHDLYSPRYRQRPIVAVDEEAVVAPPVVEGGIEPSSDLQEEWDDDPFMAAEAAAPVPQKEVEASMMLRKSRMPTRARVPSPQALRESVQVQTRTQEVGDLFCYEITEPVDIRRGRSALVPILHEDIEAERIIHYNPQIREKNPMSAFRLKNTSGLTLEGGPITVFEGDAYVGEAMLDTMREDDERITPYSVELGVIVKQDSEQIREQYQKVSKQGQFVYKHYQERLVTTYLIDSRLDAARVVYLDHRFTYKDWIDTPDPVELTDNYWRFKFEAAGKRQTRFSVSEIAEMTESIYLPELAIEQVSSLVEDGLIPKADQKALGAIAEKSAAIKRLQEQCANKDAQRKNIEKGQARLRDNLKALGQSTEELKLRNRYVAKLDKEEYTIETLRKEVSVLKKQVKDAEGELDTLIENLKLSRLKS